MPRGGRRAGAGRPRRNGAMSSMVPRSMPSRSKVLTKVSGSKVHYFKRTAYYSGSISGSTVLDTFGATAFALNLCPNYTEFTTLFDMYKICAVKVSYMPRANSAEVGTNQGLVKFFTVVDYDDSNNPTSINELLQYESLKTTNTTKDHNRYLKPKLAKALYQSAVSTAYGATRGWIDCENPGVPHYGLKYALQTLPTGNQSYDVKVTYYLAFKNVR